MLKCRYVLVTYQGFFPIIVSLLNFNTKLDSYFQNLWWDQLWNIPVLVKGHSFIEDFERSKTEEVKREKERFSAANSGLG